MSVLAKLWPVRSGVKGRVESILGHIQRWIVRSVVLVAQEFERITVSDLVNGAERTGWTKGRADADGGEP